MNDGKIDIRLSEKTQCCIDAEHRSNTDAIQRYAAFIDAHQDYAEEFGGWAVCSAYMGKVTAWVCEADVSKLEVSRPVRLIAGNPVFVVSYKGFQLNVTELK